MRIVNLRTIHGPGIYHHAETIMMTIDLEELAEKSSVDQPHFIPALLSLLPGLKHHCCSPGYPGGFVERLNRGTYFAHMIEHIALELSEAVGIGVDFGKSVFAGKEGFYHVVVRFKSEEGMKYLLEKSVEIAGKIWKQEEVNIDQIVTHAKDLVARNELGPSTRAIVNAAKRRNIPWKRVGDNSLIQLGYGKYRKFIQSTTTSETSDISVEIAQDKDLTKKFLDEASIPVPKGQVVYGEEEALRAFHQLRPPFAVKPVDGNHGRGVSLNIQDEAELLDAFRIAQNHSDGVIIEEFFHGEDYRILLVGGKLVAAAHRRPAHVTGDGIHTVSELIERENENPLRGIGHEKPMTEILIDDEASLFLSRTGVSLHDIPERGQVVFLRDTANLSTGGTANDVTKVIHPSVRIMCERAARIIGLDVCGIDLVLADISRPVTEQRGGVIEVNAGPGIRMHHYPSEGEPVDVGGAIIDSLFKEKADGRIPIVAITGTNGKTTVTRLISHVLTRSGLTVGMTTTDGITVGSHLVMEGDTTGPVSARTVLSDPSVEVAVLETARGGIVKRGLGFDWCDVGIITNIQPDHIGQDGIEGLEDILWVKSLVAERVRPGGTVILNADSPELMNYLKESTRFARRNVILFSMHRGNPELIEHAHKGGQCLFQDHGFIWEVKGNTERSLFRLSDIPITMNGTSVFNIENLMPTVAACLALNISEGAIREGLSSFRNSDNPGRLNLYQLKQGHVLLDYGHNPEAILSIGEMIRKWNVGEVTAIIGAPGDRSDELISLVGTAAAHSFSKIIIREDDDLRGRAPGEVSRLLMQAIEREHKETDCRIIEDSERSLESGLNALKDNDLLIYFYEDRDKTIETLKRHGAVLVDMAEFFQPGVEQWSSL